MFHWSQTICSSSLWSAMPAWASLACSTSSSSRNVSEVMTSQSKGACLLSQIPAWIPQDGFWLAYGDHFFMCYSYSDHYISPSAAWRPPVYALPMSTVCANDIEVTPPTSTRKARVAGCIRAWLLCLWSQPETRFTRTEVEASCLHAWWSSHLPEGVVSPFYDRYGTP